MSKRKKISSTLINSQSECHHKLLELSALFSSLGLSLDPQNRWKVWLKFPMALDAFGTIEHDFFSNQLIVNFFDDFEELELKFPNTFKALSIVNDYPALLTGREIWIEAIARNLKMNPKNIRFFTRRIVIKL